MTVVFPVPDGLGFAYRGSAEPDCDRASAAPGATDLYCDPGEEASWRSGTLAGG